MFFTPTPECHGCKPVDEWFDNPKGIAQSHGRKPVVWGFTYILKSKKDNNLYLGSTDDLRKRFKEHNLGLVKSTKSRLPFELIYYEAYRSKVDAFNREHNLKLRTKAFRQLKLRIALSIKA